jgi:hypothetical protein
MKITGFIKYASLIALGMLIGVLIFPLAYILATGDFPGARLFYGLQEDDAIVTFLLSIR